MEKVKNAVLLVLAFGSALAGLVAIAHEVIDVAPATIVPQPTPYPEGWKYDAP